MTETTITCPTYKAASKVMTKQLAKREERIDRVTQATVDIYGDREGNAGESLKEIEGLELLTLEAPKDDEDDKTPGKLFGDISASS